MSKDGGFIEIIAAASKSVGGRYFLDKLLHDLISADFVKKSNGMIARAPVAAAARIIDRLQAIGAQLGAKTNLDAARAILGETSGTM